MGTEQVTPVPTGGSSGAASSGAIREGSEGCVRGVVQKEGPLDTRAEGRRNMAWIYGPRGDRQRDSIERPL